MIGSVQVMLVPCFDEGLSEQSYCFNKCLLYFPTNEDNVSSKFLSVQRMWEIPKCH